MTGLSDLATEARPVPVRVADRRPFCLLVLRALVVIVVAGQRLGFPLGPTPVPLALVAGYAGAALLLWRGALRPDRLRLELFLVASAACAASTYVGPWWESSPLSLPSLLLLLLIYALWTLRLSDADASAQDAVLRCFLRTMLVLSALGILQMALQYSGLWSYEDPLLRWVPHRFLLTEYNTDARIAYGSPIFRGNAFLFLEPSFLSQYAALAVLIGLVQRAPLWQLALLAGGLASAVSGTGFVLLGAGLIVLVLRDRSALRPQYVATGALVLLVVSATPFAQQLLSRVGEFGQTGSSASLRFVDPYTETARGLDAVPSRSYLGAGPGTAERLLNSDRNGGLGQAVTYTIPPKLVFEYGYVAGGLFLLFLLVSMLGAGSAPGVSFALLAMTWVLSGALLQAHTAVLTWLLSIVVTRSRVPGRPAPHAP